MMWWVTWAVVAGVLLVAVVLTLGSVISDVARDERERADKEDGWYG